MWDIGDDLVKERCIRCGKVETNEHICEKVSERSQDLLKAMEYIKALTEKKDE